MWVRNVLDDHGEAALKAYRYKSGGYSWLDNLMNPFWEAVADRFPMWLAPNLVTLSGTLFLFVSFFVSLSYTPYLEGNAPAWTYVLHAVCLFAYSTLDACDGKQARRTGASSPLGQMFDHGCDALACTLIILPFCGMLQLGLGVVSVVMVSSVILPFFMAQWEEYHTHTIRTHVGFAGVTEGQYIIVACQLATAVFGGDAATLWWTTIIPLPGVNITAGLVAVLFQCGSSAFTMWSFFHNVTVSKGKPGAAVQLLPVVVHIAFTLFTVTALTEASGLAFTFVFTQCLTMSYLVAQIIVYGLCRMPYPLVQPTVGLGFALYANLVFGLVPPAAAQLTVTGVVVALYATWVLGAIHQISSILGIECFRIKPKPAQD